MNLPIKLTNCDTRGRESTTLFFVRVTWAVMVLKFLVAGIAIPEVMSFPDINISDFGLGTAGVLAIWLGREWTEKVKPQDKPDE